MIRMLKISVGVGLGLEAVLLATHAPRVLWVLPLLLLWVSFAALLFILTGAWLTGWYRLLGRCLALFIILGMAVAVGLRYRLRGAEPARPGAAAAGPRRTPAPVLSTPSKPGPGPQGAR
jgi:hypothetical protein